jgi:hypothetical protein
MKAIIDSEEQNIRVEWSGWNFMGSWAESKLKENEYAGQI